MDVMYAYGEVNSVILTLTSLSENYHAEFTRIFKNTTKIAQELHWQDFELSKPRIARRQTNRDNHDVEGAEDHFHVTIYNEFISHVVNEVLERFDNNPAKDATLGLLCLLPRKCICFEDDVALPDKLAETAKMYSDGMPHPQMLPTEYSMWIGNSDCGLLVTTISQVTWWMSSKITIVYSFQTFTSYFALH